MTLALPPAVSLCPTGTLRSNIPSLPPRLSYQSSEECSLKQTDRLFTGLGAEMTPFEFPFSWCEGTVGGVGAKVVTTGSSSWEPLEVETPQEHQIPNKKDVFIFWESKATEKVVYFTATFPYVMLVVLLVRGLTLPGAKDGIIDCVYLCLLNSLTSFVAGFAIFSVLGFMAKEQGVDISMGGLYIFQLFDYYACSGMTLLLFAVLESVCIGWIYDRQYDNIKDMIGYRPWAFMKYCWQYFTPAICTCTFLFSLVKYTPLKFNNTYEYPWWGYAIGGFFTLSSTLMVPLWMLYAVSVTPGTLRQRLKVLSTPANDLPTAMQKKALNTEAFQTFTGLYTLCTTDRPNDKGKRAQRSSIV
ncbi:hypothetical protein FQN60_009519 [Etheostoma spectabile]|uniref:Uncharacterized protein n=1 Tax=Etheostoma spectabile TaxID=54343 RepID=A0A5J5DJE9_9PERO|nr:hypothetical protein FQN60_009519 [Etheostoma spectabile]